MNTEQSAKQIITNESAISSLPVFFVQISLGSTHQWLPTFALHHDAPETPVSRSQYGIVYPICSMGPEYLPTRITVISWYMYIGKYSSPMEGIDWAYFF